MTTLSEQEKEARNKALNEWNGLFTVDNAADYFFKAGLNYQQARIDELVKELADKEEELGDLAFINGEHNDTIFKQQARIDELEAKVKELQEELEGSDDIPYNGEYTGYSFKKY